MFDLKWVKLSKAESLMKQSYLPSHIGVGVEGGGGEAGRELGDVDSPLFLTMRFYTSARLTARVRELHVF